MNVALIIIANVLITLVVCRVLYNMILTHKFNEMLGTLDSWHINYYNEKSHGTTEEEAVLAKIWARGDAFFPATMLGILWPVGLVTIVGWWIHKKFQDRLSMPQWFMAKPYRDIAAKKKQIATEEQLAEAIKILKANGIEGKYLNLGESNRIK